MFPSHYPRSVPSYIFYDDNCHLLKTIQDNLAGNRRFQNTGFPVDVFHAVHKHKDDDDFCNLNCNPASFPDLYDEETKKWRFNSSAAEQANVWYGKFLPIVREMTSVHYNFFLDEMISIHNASVERDLRKNAEPRLVPEEELKCPL